MKNYICEGDTLEVTAGSDIASGAPVLSGGLFGVATNSAKTGEVVAVRVKGVYELAKATGASWSLGDKLYWDASESEVTKTAAGNLPIGFAYQAAGSADAVGLVLLVSEVSGQSVAVADIATADGSDAGTTQTLANATKVKVNAILAALRAAGLMATS